MEKHRNNVQQNSINANLSIDILRKEFKIRLFYKQ